MKNPRDDSKDEEAPDEELIKVEPNPKVYKPLVPYPHLLSRPRFRRAKTRINFSRPLDKSLSLFH